MKPESEGPGFHWQERESEQLVVVELDNAADQIVPLKGAHMPATQDAMGIAAENAPSGSFISVNKTVICMCNPPHGFVAATKGSDGKGIKSI